MNNQYDSILEALTALQKQGYTQNFKLTSRGLFCPIASQSFQPRDLKIVEYHRFEGDSNMDDMAILYAIEASALCKGVVIDAFGTYGNSDLGDFLRQIMIVQ